MKKVINSTVSVILALVFVLCFISCNTVDNTGVWENATHLKDKEFGKGATTVEVEVKAGEQSVTFTIHTDKTILGDALIEHGLIDGEQGPYGLYVKSVNGIVADYDVDKTYWAFYIGGEYAMTGVDGTEITDGAHYELVREK